MNFKEYIARHLIGQRLHFTCDCLMHIDVVGTVVDFEIKNNEIVFMVDVSGKIIKIGENHPNMYIKKE